MPENMFTLPTPMQDVDQNMDTKLQEVLQLLKTEMESKQQSISFLEKELTLVRKESDEKSILLAKTIQECKNLQSELEGNRQLMNKLLSDLREAQNDLSWYKRTYERRSLAGLFKQFFTAKKYQ